MYANQTSQRRPSGAPVNPDQGSTAGVEQDNQQQMAEAYRAQLKSIPHLSPLHVGNNPLQQHDDFFASSQLEMSKRVRNRSL